MAARKGYSAQASVILPIFAFMRHFATSLLLGTLTVLCAGAYNDHRGHNVDSLERVVARWTPEAIDKATPEQLKDLGRAYLDLAMGYSQINGPKSLFYARKGLALSTRMEWENATTDACRYIGQHLWAQEQYDSAMFYYQAALAATQRMAARTEEYTEKDMDDNLSALYGSIGNLYNMMDSIPRAMEYYRMAGEIFDRYGWNESNSVLYYNIGETWLEEKEYGKALPAYEKSLDYARTAGDSLLVANALKGLGGLYLDTGKTWKALRCLQEADKYYSLHDDQEFRFRMENLDFMSQVLSAQKRAMAWWLGASALLVILLAAVTLIFRRLHRVKREQAEAAQVMDETLEELRRPSDKAPSLTDRERQVLALIAQGKTNPQIAETLFLSPETIKWYRKKLLVKFDVPTAAALVSKAKDLGLL